MPKTGLPGAHFYFGHCIHPGGTRTSINSSDWRSISKYCATDGFSGNIASLGKPKLITSNTNRGRKPRILDGDNRLGSEGGDKVDLLLAEWFNLVSS
jgi:hypothetical protein